MANSHHYDAIVIGAGLSGSYAAKEFCDMGLKTLMLERGRDVKHVVDYPTTVMMPWQFKHGQRVPYKDKVDNRVWAYRAKEDQAHFFTKDSYQPYEEANRFDWTRGYQVGGKSIIWGRQVQRWSDYDFVGPNRDGFNTDWPIRYKDIAPWYSEVEKFIGVAGNRDGVPALPDGEFLKPWELNVVELYFKDMLRKKYKDRYLIAGRTANLTEVKDIHMKQGRSQCQRRQLCRRGCPYGAYYSANAVTIPWALRTGNLTIRPHSVVHSIIFDDKTNKATGVRVIDEETKETTEYFAKVISLNASTIGSNLILLNSKSKRFPNGLGNDSGRLGTHMSFHNYRTRVEATCDDFKEFTEEGARLSPGYVPRFQNLERQDRPFMRGYAATMGASRGLDIRPKGFGEELTDSLMNNVDHKPEWRVFAHIKGEVIARKQNHVRLSDKKDAWGMPQVYIDINFDENDKKIDQDFSTEFEEMFHQAGFKNIKTQTDKKHSVPGADIHEMGGATMGDDPRYSVLNRWNQVHGAENVIVTDGACMNSAGTQNPSLTFMALTTRASHHLVDEMKNGNLK